MCCLSRASPGTFDWFDLSYCLNESFSDYTAFIYAWSTSNSVRMFLIFSIKGFSLMYIMLKWWSTSF